MAFVQVPTCRSWRDGLPAPTTPRHRSADPVLLRHVRQRPVVDRDGIVVDYPTLAHRIPAQTQIDADDRTSGPGSTRPGHQRTR
jgi:hypothetical protein